MECFHSKSSAKERLFLTAIKSDESPKIPVNLVGIFYKLQYLMIFECSCKLPHIWRKTKRFRSILTTGLTLLSHNLPKTPSILKQSNQINQCRPFWDNSVVKQGISILFWILQMIVRMLCCQMHFTFPNKPLLYQNLVKKLYIGA